MTRIDVIVPCYNYGDMLDPCVRSVLAQDGVSVRVLIMDDASTDSTEDVGRWLAAADARVEYRRHAVNQGNIATYNEALALVTGDYVMILSADDLLTPGSLRRATRVMDAHPEVGLTYGRDITFQYAPPIAVPSAGFCSHRIMGYRDFLERSCRMGMTPIQAPTAIVRTSLHRQIGDFRPELPHAGDTEIWLRMAAHGHVCELDADQAFRRLHATNMSLGFSPLRRLKQQKEAFDVHFDMYRDSRPEIAPLEPIVARTIAERAVWTGAHAFDGGDVEATTACLTYAATICPEMASWTPWRRLRWRLRVGPSVWRYLARIASMVRPGSTDAGVSAPRGAGLAAQ